MRTLVVSDIHIGDSRASPIFPKIIKILSEDFDRIILNGDIFDLWQEDDPKKLASFAITKKILEIAKSKEVYLVRGNHDYEIDKVAHILPGIKIVDKLEFESGNKKILAIHGHQSYPFQSKAWHNKILSKIVVWIETTFGVEIQRNMQKNCFYRDSVRDKRKKLLKKYHTNVDFIVHGHTHLIGCAQYKNTQLYDGGSTTFTKSYIVVENGCVYLRKL